MRCGELGGVNEFAVAGWTDNILSGVVSAVKTAKGSPGKTSSVAGVSSIHHLTLASMDCVIGSNPTFYRQSLSRSADWHMIS